MGMASIRFDLRAPEWATVTHAEQYAACLEQSAWADQHGFVGVTLSEHHGVDDGYLPAPLTMAGAVAGRTQNVMITIAALLLPFHDPVRIAEQIAVLDLASGGRLVVILGLGYRPGESEMAGIERRDRGPLLEEYTEVLRQAWTGEPFEWRGRTIRVTPRPLSQPHPTLLIGGSTEIAAKRAARLRCGFMPAIGDPDLDRVYQEECARLGFETPFTILPNGPGFIHVAEDPEKAWAQIGPHAVYDATTYARWQTPGQRSQVTVSGQTLDEVRASGVYLVVTPDECVELAQRLDNLIFHPLMGGMPIELGWESLELFASKVLPRLGGPGGAGH